MRYYLTPVEKMFLPPPQQQTSKVLKRVLNKKDEILKLRLEQSAKVVAEVLKDRSIVNELTGQITKKLKITGNKESLTFRELFQESDGRKTQSIDAQNPKVFSIDANVANHFKTKYLTVLKNKSYEHAEKYEILEKPSDISTNVYDDGSTCFECMNLPPTAEIYFPYSENFLTNNYGVDPNLNYTITSHAIDNSDENEGVVWNSITQTWDYVLVDDNYAWLNPTYIITIDDGPTQDEINSNTLNGNPCEFLPELNASPTLTPTILNTSPVFWGRFRLTRQAEGLFDGPSEIVLLRPQTNPTYDANGEITTAGLVLTSQVNLPKIKRKKVKEMYRNLEISIPVGTTFIGNWLPAFQDLPLVIFEFDKGTNFSITVPNITIKKENNSYSAGGTFSMFIPSRKHAYVVEPIDRTFYFSNKNIANQIIQPGLIDGWRTWGLESSCITLVQNVTN